MGSNISIEKLHNYYETAKHLDEDGKKQLQRLLNISNCDLARIKGLENETEFLLMIYLLGNVSEITQTDESYVPLNEHKSADVFVETKDHKRLCIEIKSSDNSEIKFSKKLVKDKILFSSKHSHLSYFAIKLMGHWLLLSSEYVLSRNCKITLEDDFIKSELNDIFGEMIFSFPQGLELYTTYSWNNPKSIGITHPDYGNAIRIAIKIWGEREFLITPSNKQWLILSCILENVEDVMSNQYQEIKRLDSDRILVIERFSEPTMLLKLSAFLMAPIRHLINIENHQTHTFQTYKETLKNSDHIVTRELILGVIQLLKERGYPITLIQ